MAVFNAVSAYVPPPYVFI